MGIGIATKMGEKPLEPILAKKVANSTLTISILKLRIRRGFWEKVANAF
jgi:hypothetical protein